MKKRHTLDWLRYWLLAAAASYAVTGLAGDSVSWRFIKRKVDSDFPRVSSISTASLSERLLGFRGPTPILLDVRTPAEYAVSHIQGARQVDPGAAVDTLELPRTASIVTYCSVGYRSAAFADSMRMAGFSNVQNLRGSIFQWANEGRPLTANGSSAKLVHPYGGVWRLLLAPERRAKVPPVK